MSLKIFFRKTFGGLKRDKKNAQLLFAAINARDYQEVRRLLDESVDPDVPLEIDVIRIEDPASKTEEALDGTILRRTALMIAAEQGDSEMVTILLQAGAIPTHEVDTHTALEIAVSKDHIEIVRLLLAKANLKWRSPTGKTLLMLAAEYGAIKTTHLLIIDLKVDINETRNGATALLLAKRSVQPEIVKLLEGAGAVEGKETSLFNNPERPKPLP